MTETIQLRAARDDDAAVLTKLFVMVQSAMNTRVPQDPEAAAFWFCDMLLPEADVTVAERDGAVVGFSAVRDGFLQQLCVHPDHVGRTIGSQLIKAAQNAHPEGLFVEVPEDTPRIATWLERAGFAALSQPNVTVASGGMRAMRWRAAE